MLPVSNAQPSSTPLATEATVQCTQAPPRPEQTLAPPGPPSCVLDRPQPPRSPPCAQERQASAVFWRRGSRPLARAAARRLACQSHPRAPRHQQAGLSLQPPVPSRRPPLQPQPQGFHGSSPLPRGSKSAPARAPQGLTTGGELLEGWKLLGPQGAKEQVLDHLCPPALQQLGKRCWSCYKTPLLLSSSSSSPLPQAASPTLSRGLLSPPPGSRAAPAEQSAGKSSPGVAQASTGSVAGVTVGRGSCRCDAGVPL